MLICPPVTYHLVVFAKYCVNKIATTLIFGKVSNADHSILESSVKLTELYNLACFWS